MCAQHKSRAVQLYGSWQSLKSGLQTDRRKLYRGFGVISSSLLEGNVTKLYPTRDCSTTTSFELFGLGRQVVNALTGDLRIFVFFCGSIGIISHIPALKTILDCGKCTVSCSRVTIKISLVHFSRAPRQHLRGSWLMVLRGKSTCTMGSTRDENRAATGIYSDSEGGTE